MRTRMSSLLMTKLSRFLFSVKYNATNLTPSNGPLSLLYKYLPSSLSLSSLSNSFLSLFLSSIPLFVFFGFTTSFESNPQLRIRNSLSLIYINIHIHLCYVSIVDVSDLTFARLMRNLRNSIFVVEILGFWLGRNKNSIEREGFVQFHGIHCADWLSLSFLLINRLATYIYLYT